ncbi:MAG: transposase [Candidatus Marinimicrobia bacterium]|nr:transposase [Candidatus Neomarinimicrobiota bacterium]
MKYYKENYYHIYNRGIDGKSIFFNRENYVYFIRLLKRYSKRYDISILAYCLIPNHYHLLVYQNSDISISNFIQSLNNAFVQGINRQLKRKGTLFEGRAKSKHINKEEYLMHLCRYIHLNPVKHNLVSNGKDWEFSNYLVCLKRDIDNITELGFIEDLVGSTKNYFDFVNEHSTAIVEKRAIKDYALE